MVKLILAAMKNQQFIGGFGESHKEMIREKVTTLTGIASMITELKLAVTKRRVKMLSKREDPEGKS